MMEKRWKDLSESLKLSDESRERIRTRLTSQPTQQEVICMKKKTLYLRAPLVAAVLAVVLAATALAVEWTVGWESFLGRAPREAVTPVDVSAVTGDYTLTLQESIVDDDGAAFLLALTRNDGGVLEGEPQLRGNLYGWDVKVDGEFPNMSTESHQPIFSEDRKTAYYCMEFEAQGEQWDETSVIGRTITFQCDGVVDLTWGEEELAESFETVSLAPLAQTARQVDMSYEDICGGENESELLALVEELSAQASIPLTLRGEEMAQVRAVFFTNDGCPMVAVSDRDRLVRQGQYLISQGVAVALTDTRTGERWAYQSGTRRGDDENTVYVSGFNGSPLTAEDLPYMEVTVKYTMDKVLSDQPVELSFTAGEGHQRTVALDTNISFNYLGDCTAHVTGAKLSALRLELTFDRLERSGWDWENHPEKNTKWALVNKDGTRVLLCAPMIRQNEETGEGYIRLEGVDENGERRLIDPDQVAALDIGGREVRLDGGQ